ncbi:MAG: sugar ABC transporter permease, partial [Pirellulales bacterium]|nr:sugar ABC transporter permease [Pirellulales bacterium]
ALLLTEDGVKRIWNSFVFVAFTLVFAMPLGIGLALVLDGEVRFRTAIRTILIIPWLVSNIVGALLWAWILNAQFGPIAYAASLFGTTIPNAPTSLSLAMPSVVLVNVWSTYPLVMIFVLAALQTVPRELHEAASIDGATAVQRFASVTFPCIKNTLLVALVLTTLWSFNMVTIILVMTGGGPVGATDTMAFNIWEEGFRLYRMGMASTGAVVVFVINIAFAIAYMRVLRDRGGGL